MHIQDVMTADVSFVGPDTPILEIARKMRDGDIGSTPVVEDERLVGVVSRGDLARIEEK
jgi:CBS domain-containing protein